VADLSFDVEPNDVHECPDFALRIALQTEALSYSTQRQRDRE